MPKLPKGVYLQRFGATVNSVTLQESGTVVFSMDALFGLPRKKSAGKSFREAIHGHYFFKQQHEVDEYVSTAPTKKRKDLKVIKQHDCCFAYMFIISVCTDVQ